MPVKKKKKKAKAMRPSRRVKKSGTARQPRLVKLSATETCIACDPSERVRALFCPSCEVGGDPSNKYVSKATVIIDPLVHAI